MSGEVLSRRDVHCAITDKIVAAVKAGADDYCMPWHRTVTRPVNAFTGKVYTASTCWRSGLPRRRGASVRGTGQHTDSGESLTPKSAMVSAARSSSSTKPSHLRRGNKTTTSRKPGSRSSSHVPRGHTMPIRWRDGRHRTRSNDRKWRFATTRKRSSKRHAPTFDMAATSPAMIRSTITSRSRTPSSSSQLRRVRQQRATTPSYCMN